MALYELAAVARTPQSTGAPTLTEIGPIVAPQISWRRALSAPSELRFSCQPDKLSDAVRSRLVALEQLPLEVWLYRDGVVVEAGFVQGYQVQGASVSFFAPGLLGYLAYMGVEADLTFTSEDQFTIGKELVDQSQDLAYGNYGLDTSGIGTSGVDRDRAWRAVDRHGVLQRLLELGQADDGFDVHVDPATRALVFTHPQRGSDLSNSVFLDARNISDAGTVVSVAPGDLASDAFGVGTGADQEPLTSTLTNTDLRESWGRAWVSATFDGVSVQGDLDDHTQALLDARSTHLFLPAPGLIPVAGAEVGDFDEGDTVTYSFDDGLGLRTAAFRLTQLQVDVDVQGRETMAVSFG